MESKDKTISGFSKLSKTGKIKWIVKTFFKEPDTVMSELMSYWHSNEEQQKILDNFSENTISNFPMPFGVAPNFVIDGHPYCVPMVIEESSVVAAASSAAKFWMTRGGFKTEVLATKKLGQVHFKWSGDTYKLNYHFESIKKKLLEEAFPLTESMVKRGGGIMDIELIDLTDQEPHLYQLLASFETCDSMGANFINTCLEQFGQSLTHFFKESDQFAKEEEEVEIVMSILSNYTPECLVRAWVECPVSELGEFPNGMTGESFAEKFKLAVRIAEIDPYRATTHNKGIYNGVDSVVIATGNDFRAIEACGHTYAAKDGTYSSLSHCEIKDGQFKFWLDLPLAIGTVGGLTSLHPIAKRSLELLDDPDANKLMRIIAATGLAQNFSALRSLITTGIQKGHMKMHLQNILNQLKANQSEQLAAIEHFSEEIVSFSAVKSFLEKIRLG
ncbi:MAG: hydroxymethylglutaryl-CoA reductase, degradative [Saprospiraceae bacterium]|nr:hydroxymethylglutaryl-CoA reductase, degradative [Bacteroidia bacterium]NNE15962.1 hydroxymethylglutaryl-CoA reductase, degradative [Saprospiraceae bacterium]NNL93597.1 hydroxymethylglutaryl-CoA reductase, degradative [Saprospiraceae bacterium]